MLLTDQQKAIVALRPRRGTLVHVKAFAGTGKTATLAKLAERMPGAVYLVYNKAAQLDAARRLPKSVRCMTVHSLAFQEYGRPYRDRLGDVRSGDAAEWLQSQGHLRRGADADVRWVVSSLLAKTLQGFVQSEDASPQPAHVPHMRGLRLAESHDFDRARLAELATDMWADMVAMRGPLSMPHDGYLKLYQLHAAPLEAPAILLDEAQDSNSSTLSIIDKAEGFRLMVGDPHQQIYAFRGSVDAFDRFDPDIALELTGSFRFGGKTASLANRLLALHKGETSLMEGLGPKGSDPEGRPLDCVLCRTNVGALMTICSRLDEGARVHLEGGTPAELFREAHDMARFLCGRLAQVESPLLRDLETLEALKSYIESSEDAAMALSLSFVQRVGPGALRSLQARLDEELRPPSSADVSVSTAHKAKGLEWARVSLGDDFPKVLAKACTGCDDGLFRLSEDEANLIYVAATRGRRDPAPCGWLEAVARGERPDAPQNS